MRTSVIILLFILSSGLCFGQTFFEYYDNGVKYAGIDSLTRPKPVLKMP